MGPRPGGRGEMNFHGNQTARHLRLQWGRALVGAERMLRYLSPLWRGELQWGRALVGAERRHKERKRREERPLQWGRALVGAERVKSSIRHL